MNRVWRSLGGLMALAFLGLCAMTGCPGPEPQAAATGGSTGTTSSSSSSSSSTDTTPSGTSTGGQCSCPEFDVLFVQDNSDSIPIDLWSELVYAVVQAGSSITEMLERACSFHVGVVTSTAELNNPSGCQTLGDLSRVDNSGDPCPVANGRFITEADSENFQQAMTCLLTSEQRSVNGQETPMEALFAALAPAANAPGGCNEGFLRDGAPLLLVIISDVDDSQSDVDGDQQPDIQQSDTAGIWYDELIQIKGSDDLVAAIGILGPAGTPDPSCPAEEVDELRNFVGSFLSSHEAILPICDMSGTKLTDAVDALGDELCPP